MAVKFYLPDGGKTDIVALTLPCFFVRTPEDFLSFTPGAQGPGAADAGLARRPPRGAAGDPGGAGRRARRPATPPARTTRSTPTAGSTPTAASRFVRYRWEPEAGEQTLSPEDAKARGRDYLQEDILARGESAFRLQVIVAAEEDAVDDPTVAWPEEREHVEVGRLVLDGPGAGARARRRRARLRPDPRDRRDRALRRRDPALPRARPTRCRSSAGSAPGRQVERVAPRHALAELLLALDLGVQLGAEQQRDVRQPQPADQQDRAR